MSNLDTQFMLQLKDYLHKVDVAFDQNVTARFIIQEVAKENREWAKELRLFVRGLYLENPDVSDNDVLEKIKGFRPSNA